MTSSSITPELLNSLLSPDGAIRSQAETVFYSVSTTDRIQGLLTVLSQIDVSKSPIGLLTAVLLRRDIVKLDSPNLLVDLVQPLLQAFQANKCPLQVGHCLAEVCSSLTLVHPESVANVLSSILSTLQASFQQGYLPSLQVLAALADKAPMAFTQLAADSIPNLYGAGWSTAAMEAWTEVLVNTAVATTVTSVSIGGATAPTTNLDELVVDPTSKAVPLAQALLPVLQFIAAADPRDESSVKAILSHLAHVSTTCPSFIAGNAQVFASLIQTCLHIAAKTSSSELQLASVQVLSALVSVGEIRRRFLSNEQAAAIASNCLPICAQILASNLKDADEEQEWAQEPATLVQDGMDDDDETDDFLFAVMLIESLLSYMGALPVILPLVESLLQSAGKERAGLVLLDCALVSTPFTLTPHLPVVLQAATALASSSSPCTQRQALGLLGALCETHSEWAAQPQVSQAILENLAAGLASACSKISVTASLGLVSFCRGDGDHREIMAEALAVHRTSVLTALIQGPLSLTTVDSGSVAVRVRAMGAAACVAEASGEEFAPFYSTFMPGLLATAQLPVVELTGAAVEAATIVGQAIGKETFQADATKLLGWIIPALQTDTSILEPLLLACARIASVLEEDFVTYVEAVLPVLLVRAQESPDVSIMVSLSCKGFTTSYRLSI